MGYAWFTNVFQICYIWEFLSFAFCYRFDYYLNYFVQKKKIMVLPQLPLCSISQTNWHTKFFPSCSINIQKRKTKLKIHVKVSCLYILLKIKQVLSKNQTSIFKNYIFSSSKIKDIVYLKRNMRYWTLKTEETDNFSHLCGTLQSSTW